VSLGLGLSADVMPGSDLYARDLGRRRTALLENWDRLHELRSAPSAGRAPAPRALRLEIETAALSALAVALTDASRQRAPSDPAAADDPAPADRDTRAAAPPRLVRTQTPLLLEEFQRISRALRDSLVLDTESKGWPHDLRKGQRHRQHSRLPMASRPCCCWKVSWHPI
jgi:hypothetical protein